MPDAPFLFFFFLAAVLTPVFSQKFPPLFCVPHPSSPRKCLFSPPTRPSARLFLFVPDTSPTRSTFPAFRADFPFFFPVAPHRCGCRHPDEQALQFFPRSRAREEVRLFPPRIPTPLQESLTELRSPSPPKYLVHFFSPSSFYFFFCREICIFPPCSNQTLKLLLSRTPSL